MKLSEEDTERNSVDKLIDTGIITDGVAASESDQIEFDKEQKGKPPKPVDGVE